MPVRPLWKATSERPPFHAHTDEIVDHYAPLLQDAISRLFTVEQVRHAVRQAYGAVLKDIGDVETTGPPPHLRNAEGKPRCASCCLARHPLCVKYGNWRVRPDQVCDGWTQDPSVLKEAQPSGPTQTQLDQAKVDAIAALQGNADPSALNSLLHSLYGDAALQGTHEAAVAAGGVVFSGLASTITSLPSDYWDNWKPGFGAAAAKDANGGLKELLDARDVRIKGITDTQTEKLGNVIADGLKNGDSISTTVNNAMSVLGDSGNASTIVNTEYASAMTAANMDTYVENGVEQIEFMAESDACPDCEENADASPIGIDEDWPNSDVPVHPNCRCAIAPVVNLS
jgi:SPP1 gp7 family putative phage head morphogenesis protein